jgi:hypothetical protein
MQTTRTHITKFNQDINITNFYTVLKINSGLVQTVHVYAGYFLVTLSKQQLLLLILKDDQCASTLQVMER